MTTPHPDQCNGAGLPRILPAILALLAVLTLGTCGFMVIEDQWGFWKSLYFTMITITTVGYGDYGLSPVGERFTTVLMVFGIATAAYAFSHLVQAAVSRQLAWRQKMQKKIDQLRDHYIICGSGRVGRTVFERLAEAALPFVVIEMDHDRFEQVCARGYLAIHGIATEDRLLLQAGIARARGIICAVDSDSENIVITLGARELNPDIQIISRADEEGAIHKVRRAGASHVISPALTGGEEIANLIIQPLLAEFLEQSRSSDNGYKLAEAIIHADSPLAGRTVQEFGDQEESLALVALKRADGSTQISPGAAEVIEVGDVVIIVGEPEAVRRLSQKTRARPGVAAAVAVV